MTTVNIKHIVTYLVLLILLIGCGGENDGNNEPDNADTNIPIDTPQEPVTQYRYLTIDIFPTVSTGKIIFMIKNKSSEQV